MANPFPGMDPYLEGDLWPSVHLDLAAEVVRTLGPLLRPKYRILSSHRYLMADGFEPDAESRARLPDANVLRRPGGEVPPSGTAVLTPPMVSSAEMGDDEELQVTLEVFEAGSRRLVTAIEILSPTNKAGPGRRKYAAKRDQFLRSPVHLVEVDLLRAGARFPVRDPLPPAAYFAFVSRADRRPDVEIWPAELEDVLPTVPIPLAGGDRDMLLDLNAAFRAVHEIVGYDDFLVDYAADPPGPLTPSQRTWVDGRLRAAGLRK